MKISIDRIKIAERIRKEITHISELAENIRQNGLLHPVIIMPLDGGEFRLLAGLRRLKAAQVLGWTEIEVNVVSPTNAEAELRIEISENEQRKEFTYSERMDFARLIEEIERAKARERMLAGKCANDPGVERPQGADDDPNEKAVTYGRTNDIVAPKVGMSGATYKRAKYIANNATPETIEQLDKGEKTITGVYAELRAEEKAKTDPKPTVEDPPKSEPPKTPKQPKLSDKEKEERAMAMLSPRDRETVERHNAFVTMTPEQKIAELQSQLKAERSRAAVAETELSRLKDELHNAVLHRDGIISSLERQLESAHARISELEADEHDGA